MAKVDKNKGKDTLILEIPRDLLLKEASHDKKFILVDVEKYKWNQDTLELDKAYIPTRYPNAHPTGSPRQKPWHGKIDLIFLEFYYIISVN